MDSSKETTKTSSVSKCNFICTIEVNGVSLQLDPIAHFKEKREKEKHHRLMISRNLPQLPSGLILKVNWYFMYR